MINMSIRNIPIGTLDPELVNKCMQARHFSSQEETLIYYFKKGWDFEESADIDECLKEAQRQIKKYGLDDIASLMAVKMHKDLRPTNEICKNCDMYDKQFCCYKLCRVNPFEKGCEGWSPIEGNDNKVTPIKYLQSQPDVEQPRTTDKSKVVSIENYDAELPKTIDEARKMVADILKDKQ